MINQMKMSIKYIYIKVIIMDLSLVHGNTMLVITLMTVIPVYYLIPVIQFQLSIKGQRTYINNIATFVQQMGDMCVHLVERNSNIFYLN